MAATAEDANVWATGLLALTSNKRGSPSEMSREQTLDDCRPSSSSWATIRERWLESVFEEADADKRGFVGEATAVKLIRQINPRLSLNRVLSKVKVCERMMSIVRDCRKRPTHRRRPTGAR